MAIGSAPEIGTVVFWFTDCKTEEERDAWYANVRRYGDDLLAGYATLGYPSTHRGTPPLALGGTKHD